MMTSTPAATQKSLVASILMYAQAVLIGLTGASLAAFADDRRRRFSRRFFQDRLLRHSGAWAIVLIVLAVALVMIGIGAYWRRSWAAVCAYVAEAIVGVGGLPGFHPMRSMVGLGVAVVVILLVASDRHDLSTPQRNAPNPHAGPAPA